MIRFLTRYSTNWILSQHARFCSSTTTHGRLEGKIALITGAASGLGKATAQEFVKQGAYVVLADVNVKTGAEATQELGPKAQFIQCDVGVESQVAEAIDTVIAQHGKLDIMYNNVGIVGQFYPTSITDLDMENFDQVMRINVRGTLIGVKHATRVMKPMGSGSILCTASICGILGGLGPHSYSISKFTIPGIVRSLASELSQYGLRINCLSPAVIATPGVIQNFQYIYPKATREELNEIIRGTSELRGTTTCEEIDVAKAALYLVSDDAKYVTGHNLVIDGGMTSFKFINLPSPDQLM